MSSSVPHAFHPSEFDFGTKALLGVATTIVLSGCASVDFDRSIANTNEQVAGFTNGQLALVSSNDQRAEMDKLADEILSKPVGQSDAGRLKLIHSPDLQAMLAQNWPDAPARRLKSLIQLNRSSNWSNRVKRWSAAAAAEPPTQTVPSPAAVAPAKWAGRQPTKATACGVKPKAVTAAR